MYVIAHSSGIAVGVSRSVFHGQGKPACEELYIIRHGVSKYGI